MKTIKKSVEIKASKEKVWDILFDTEKSKAWYEAFMAGSHAEGNWTKDSLMLFKDAEGTGLAARVVEITPGELVDLQYEAVVYNGKLNYDDQEAQDWKGLHETYRVTGNGVATTLAIESGVPDRFFGSMDEAWDNAIKKIKELAEN
ncbi:MAG TPA: SRPBCC domain-containing protein [Bacteroidia bacterium]|nr:SRPBCC domain-containing protein [Bacteroidia bacterium]